MNWKDLTSIEELENILQESHQHPVAIFKHSTRCSISSTAKNRLERGWNFESNQVTPYFLDLIAHRNVSNAIADQLGVVHQSPQLIVIKNGKAVYDASHMTIYVDDITEVL
ncbi:MAG: bacillithiol system redox-active protein YtxJ [Aureispira sp.]|nr:bacillithiol system redox-active protein YtxJ [Aureispira sp.]